MDPNPERRRMMAEALALWKAHRAAEAVQVYERCLLLFEPADRSSDEYATFCNNFGSAAVTVGQLARAESMFRAARDIYVERSSGDDLARIDFNLGNVYRGMGRLDRSTEHFERALRFWRHNGDEHGAARCLVSLTLNAIGAGRIEDARAHLAEIDALGADAREDPEVRWSSAIQRAEIALNDGNPDEAVAHAEASLRIAREMGDPGYTAQSANTLRRIRAGAQAGGRQDRRARSNAAPARAAEPELPLLRQIDAASLQPMLDVAAQSGVRTTVLTLVDQVLVVTAAGPPAVTWIDAGSPDLLARLDRDAMLDDPLAGSQWRGFAQQAAQLGIARREQGQPVEAYVHQRFALFVTVRRKEARGVTAVAANIFVLREAIRDLTERGLGPPRGPEWQAVEQDMKDRLLRTLEFMRFDAWLVAGAVADLAQEAGIDSAQRVELLLAWHRLARIAGDDPACATAFRALIEGAEEVGHPDAVLVAAADDVAQMDSLEALGAAGVLRAGDRPDTGTADAWQRYTRLQSRIPTVRDATRVARGCAVAFRHLCHLRLRATTAGGAFGHELSYALSTLLQSVGRDLAGLLHRAERDDEALSVAEMLLARSMADWMARTHAIWAFPAELRAVFSGLTGSLNAVAVADLDQVRAAAREVDAPLLYYLWQSDHYLAWLVRTDGRIATARIEDPSARLAHLLPSIVSEWRDVTARVQGRAPDNDLDVELAGLHDMLFPLELRDALADQGERLIIIADPSIQAVPFCALRTPAGRYLIEEHELLFWPSVTCWLNLEAGARVAPSVRARVEPGRKPLVLGIGSFDRTYRTGASAAEPSIDFEDLPNAPAEARQVAALLDTEALLDDDARVDTLLEAGSGTAIIHLATHGHLDEAHPRQSFLAFADGTLTAEALYRLDRGVRTGLVVLSACETALGGSHADSVIGLANAFLIAGAGAVVSTLWPISDDATPTFMSHFYEALRDGDDLAAALRQAQLALLARPETRDPFFWAPFVVTGRSANPLATPGVP